MSVCVVDAAACVFACVCVHLTYTVLHVRQEFRSEVVGGLSRELSCQVVYCHQHYPIL